MIFGFGSKTIIKDMYAKHHFVTEQPNILGALLAKLPVVVVL